MRVNDGSVHWIAAVSLMADGSVQIFSNSLKERVVGPSLSGAGGGRLFTGGLITYWYSSSTSACNVLLLNKYLLCNVGFKYSIFLTMRHMTTCSLLSYIAIAWFKFVPLQTIRSRVQFFKISTLSLSQIPPRQLQPGRGGHHPFNRAISDELI